MTELNDLDHGLSQMHGHCEMCFLRNCNITPDGINGCELSDCLQGCGARLHLCKLKDHSIVCLKEKVHCINYAYGCPIEMQREKLKFHLNVCPASVIPCSVQWNRWPMYSSEEGWRAPLPLDNPHVRCTQLDVALAMRDQRMLMKSFKVPKRTRKILCNPLTQKFPPVPFHSSYVSVDSDSEETSHTMSDEDEAVPWDKSRPKPGLQETICLNLRSPVRKTPDSVKAMIDYSFGKQGLSKLAELYRQREEENQKHQQIMENGPLGPETKNSESKSHTSLGMSLDSNSKLFSQCDEDDSVSNGAVGVKTNDRKCEISIYKTKKKLHEILGLDLNVQYLPSYLAKPVKMFTFMCSQEFRRDEYPWHEKNFHNDIQHNLNGWLEQRCPLSYLGCCFTFRRLSPSVPCSRVIHSTFHESLGLESLICMDQQEDDIIYKPFDYLNLDQNDHSHDLETAESRLREATPEVYTSYKFDSDVQIVPKYKSYFSRETSPAFIPPEPCDILTSLPFEILQKIAQHLDSFSLISLSVTSRLLRDVCCSILDNKGIVSLVWEKQRSGQQKPFLWNVAYKRWSFSTSFTPITGWKINQSCLSAISEHLKICPFNQPDHKNIKTEPFKAINLE
ncbi:hypothetical protein CHS0354_030180 [Potamilus streckersoni]|uniref:F-box protein n=1 Tax=Potamilus streckersoni TaxID=2493646 RepID=A0AAE0W292_9BIVA|nr:hypothetical protein CHS0354_030180 [Potamilus streckersoni]